VDTQLFLTILLLLMIGSATAYFADQRGRDPLLWFMIGMMLDLLGLILLFLLPVINPETTENPPHDTSKPAELESQPSQDMHHDYLIKDWYYYNSHHERQGPVRYDALKLLWQAGELKEESYVWSEGMGEWKQIEQIPTLHAHLVIQD
jgi:hypothetical protein